MAQKADILVLGATGFTGKLVVRYLSTHPEYTSSPRKFTFALAGRSRDRLSKIAAEHHLPAADVPLITVDTNSISDIDIAISSARVVINVVGPFWKYSRGVAIACAARGVHYVDLTGEAPFMRYVIDACDVPARTSGAILIPGSGQDCIPSDLTVFLANKTLKARFPERSLTKSTSAFHARGEVSGGTISTLYSFFEDIPAEVRKGTRGPWALSPVKGARQPGIKFTYDLPYEKLVGGFWMMAPIDKAVVLRSWGLFERAAKEKPEDDEAQALAYGPEFAYDEFMVTKNKLIGAVLTFGLFFMVILTAIPPTRWLMKRLLPQPGSGPSEESMQNGFLKVTNMTYSSGDEVGRRALIRTRWEGRGDPGYLLTSILIAESALALALDHDRLPTLARSGGAFTPATALGDVLLERLKRTGRMKFESQIVSESA